MILIKEISNIKLHYARTIHHPYGSMGKPYTSNIDKKFNDELTACFDQVFDECPLGKPQIITTAGIFANRPGSQHYKGKGFDLDAIFWDDYSLITLNFVHDPELYLGIESFLRMHFGLVLNHHYNSQHRDHWHIDNSRPVDFNTSSRTDTLYIQLVLTYIFKTPVLIDGVYGPQTGNALQNALDKLNLSGKITNPVTYKAFLSRTGKLAFQLFQAKKSPKRLLNNVYDTISDLNLDPRNLNTIREALDLFKNHEDTENWLKNYEDAKYVGGRG